MTTTSTTHPRADRVRFIASTASQWLKCHIVAGKRYGIPAQSQPGRLLPGRRPHLRLPRRPAPRPPLQPPPLKGLGEPRGRIGGGCCNTFAKLVWLGEHTLDKRLEHVEPPPNDLRGGDAADLLK